MLFALICLSFASPALGGDTSEDWDDDAIGLRGPYATGLKKSGIQYNRILQERRRKELFAPALDKFAKTDAFKKAVQLYAEYGNRFPSDNSARFALLVNDRSIFGDIWDILVEFNPDKSIFELKATIRDLNACMNMLDFCDWLADALPSKVRDTIRELNEPDSEGDVFFDLKGECDHHKP